MMHLFTILQLTLGYSPNIFHCCGLVVVLYKLQRQPLKSRKSEQIDTMKRRTIGGLIGAIALLLAIVAVSVDELFVIRKFRGRKGQRVDCGWYQFHHSHGHSIAYWDADELEHGYWGKSGIAGRIWVAFMVQTLSILSSSSCTLYQFDRVFRS